MNTVARSIAIVLSFVAAPAAADEISSLAQQALQAAQSKANVARDLSAKAGKAKQVADEAQKALESARLLEANARQRLDHLDTGSGPPASP